MPPAVQGRRVRRDATLDEFAGSDAESGVDEEDGRSAVDGSNAEPDADEANGEPEADEADGESAAEASAVESTEATADEEGSPSRDAGTTVVPTSTWTPEGAPCAACGAVVERRWRQDGALVCPACKTWDVS